MSVKASATLTSTGTALTNNDTVTIGSRVYTYKTTLTGAANEVLIGAATASVANLKAAVNRAAGEGTTYGTGTPVHADVDAGTLTGNNVLLFTAKVAGEAGNAIAKAESAAQLSWDAGTTFTGGADTFVELNDEQRRYVQEVVRPMTERLVAVWYELDMYVRDADNQQSPIASSSDILNDGPGGGAPRTDAPWLLASMITQQRNFCANMRDQISETALNALMRVAVRDVRAIVRN